MHIILQRMKRERHIISVRSCTDTVFQALIPGQFLTYGGKYYEVQSITPRNGVVVRRAADHITGRKYYRQIRHIAIRNWQDDTSVGGQKSLGDIRILKGYCQVEVQTDGYLEMQDYHDLKMAVISM